MSSCRRAKRYRSVPPLGALSKGSATRGSRMFGKEMDCFYVQCRAVVRTCVNSVLYAHCASGMTASLVVYVGWFTLRWGEFSGWDDTEGSSREASDMYRPIYAWLGMTPASVMPPNIGYRSRVYLQSSRVCLLLKQAMLTLEPCRANAEVFMPVAAPR